MTGSCPYDSVIKVGIPGAVAQGLVEMLLYLRNRFPEQKSPMYFSYKRVSGGESRIIYDAMRVAHCRAEGRLYKLLLQCQELCHRFVTDIVLEFAIQVT